MDSDPAVPIDQVVDVGHVFEAVVVIWLFEGIVDHYPKLLFLPVVVVMYCPQGWLELEFSTDPVYLSVLAHEGEGIEVSESETQNLAFGKELWAFEESAGCRLEATESAGIGRDNEGG